MPMILDGSNGITMPTWTTANRPTNPIIGAQGYNTTYGGVEVYNGSAWTLVTGGPAFSVYLSGSGQTFSSGTNTKIQFNAKEFDTANCYDPTTNYRFTPTVPGYYQLTSHFRCDAGNTEVFLNLYKNGSQFKHFYDISVTQYGLGGTALVYANGTTDYFEMYYYQGSGSNKTSDYSTYDTYFQGTFVRGQ